MVVPSLTRGIGSGLHVWVFTVRSWSSPVAGGGSGGGLVRGNGGDSRGVDGAPVSLSADLVK